MTASSGPRSQVVKSQVVSVRAATSTDVDSIAEIWRRGWDDAHRGKVPKALVSARGPATWKPRARTLLPDTLVACVGDQVGGFVTVRRDEVEQLYVAGEHRGTGLAATLLRAAEDLVAERGHTSAWLAVVSGNVRARRFYERLGWRDDGPIAYPARVGGDAEGPTIRVPCRRYVRESLRS